MKQERIRITTETEEEPENYIDLPFLDPDNDYEKCLNSFAKNITKLVKDNPGITTYDVYQRELKRMRICKDKVTDSIKRAFTVALANNLGETIQCLGKSKKREGNQYYEQLSLFEG